MSLIRTAYCQKDGPYKRNYYRRHTDLSKPKCWVEGFQYRFNSYVELVAIEILPLTKQAVRKHLIKSFYDMI